MWIVNVLWTTNDKKPSTQWPMLLHVTWYSVLSTQYSINAPFKWKWQQNWPKNRKTTKKDREKDIHKKSHIFQTKNAKIFLVRSPMCTLSYILYISYYWLVGNLDLPSAIYLVNGKCSQVKRMFYYCCCCYCYLCVVDMIAFMNMNTRWIFERRCFWTKNESHWHFISQPYELLLYS